MKSIHFPTAASDRPHARGAAKRKHKTETARQAEPVEIQDYNPEANVGRYDWQSTPPIDPAELNKIAADHLKRTEMAEREIPPFVPNGGRIDVGRPLSPAEVEFISGRPISGLESGPFLNLEERRSAFVAEITKMAPKLFGLPSANGLTALHNISVQLQVVNAKMKTILGSADRHGDLQVIHSACSHMLENLKVLIHLEEIN